MIGAVKIVSALFLCLTLSPVRGADPGAAAMDFLGKVRDGSVDLEPGADTALLGHITEGKRETIRIRIERLEAELTGGELELGEVKEDDGFAAAIIRKTGGFDSTEVQVFPVALVKRGGKWLAAPLPASFENAVAGYTMPLKERLSALENWMTRKRVTDLERLMTDSAQRTRLLIRNSIIGEDLEGDDLGKIADRFLESCAKGDRAAILGFLGGLSDPLPPDWSSRIKASRDAVGGGGNWRALVSPEVLRVRIREERDGKDGEVSIGCLDPQTAATKGVRFVHLAFSRDAEGRWGIDLPDALLLGRQDSGDEGSEESLLHRFSERFAEAEPAVHAESARAAEMALLEALKSGGVRDTLRRIDLGKGCGDSGNRPKDGSKACAEAAAVWWSLNEPGAFRQPVELGFREEGSLAAFAYQWFSVSEPDRYELRTLFFRETGDGWLWCPGVVPKESREDHAALTKWAANMEAQWRLSWRESLMKPSVRLDEVVFGEPPSDEAVKALVAGWLAALERRDLGAALATAAWLGGGEEIPMKALRNISFELVNAGRGKAEMAAIHRSGAWAAASVRFDSGERVHEIFLPVVATPEGPRLLPEIDLIFDDTRSRNFLNKASFERLRKHVGEEKASELEGLFEDARKMAE
jgi:hypothetical protein